MEKGKKDIDVIMHFVNESYNPLLPPVIKRYRFQIDENTKLFMTKMEKELVHTSKFYRHSNKFRKKQKKVKAAKLADSTLKKPE